MKNLKIINEEKLKDWAKEIFQKNSFNMVDVSSKKETFRRALASGKIYVGIEVFNLIKNKITLYDICIKENLKLTTSNIAPFSHWITPDIEIKRFDTRFFIAYLPENQTEKHDHFFIMWAAVFESRFLNMEFGDQFFSICFGGSPKPVFDQFLKKQGK